MFFWRNFLYPVFLLYSKPLHQPCELLWRNLTGLGRCPGPLEPSRLQSFVNKEESVAFPQKPLDPVSAPSAEHKKSSFLEWIKLKMILYDPHQAVYPKAEIRIAVCQVNAAV